MDDLEYKKKKQEKFNRRLMKALDDEDVLQKIEEIIQNSSGSKKGFFGKNNGDQIDKLKNEIAKLRKENEELPRLRKENEEIPKLRKENEELPKLKKENEEIPKLKKENEEISKLRKENEEIPKLRKENEEIPKLRHDIENVEKELKISQKKYNSVADCYDSFLKLPEQLRSELRGVLYDSSLPCFYACAGKMDFVNRFADNIQHFIIGGRYKEYVEQLTKIFDFLFDAFNESEGSPKYIRAEVSMGDEFNTNKHITTKLQQGIITKIYFKGYYNADIPDTTIKKSIVEVSES